jgi:AraC family transcriptional regulator of adaptative response/methylated-DNA-[protein]-cysteine methyltransferase
MKHDATLPLLLPEPQPLVPPRSEMERAFAARDADYDGVFFVAVRTTGIFCRPSCPSRPDPRNIEFLPTVRECLFAGYRPCKRCHPTHVDGSPPPWVAGLMKLASESPDGKLRPTDLQALGISPERARRWFKENQGMTFAAWCRAHRLAEAFHRIRNGTSLDDAGLDAGFESTSGFREAFARTFGTAPGRARSHATADRIVVALIESPVGLLLTGARDDGICLLEFTDRRMLERNLATLGERFRCPRVPGNHPHLDTLRDELSRYFRGELRDFTVPVVTAGTPFQTEVWNELRRIPYARTISYEELAQRLGRPTGQRAVARANGDNRISILIPCHRVIGKDGQLTGYGGGLWRKRLLLELERTGRLPGSI